MAISWVTLDHVDEVAERVATSREIIIHARECGMSPTYAQVFRQYRWWLRWHTGAITKGYLMRATGIRSSHVR